MGRLGFDSPAAYGWRLQPASRRPSSRHRTLFDQAFAAIVRNRMQRGGIMAPRRRADERRHSEIDHEELFAVAARLQGDFLMTYDNAAPVVDLARKHRFDTQEIAMKNTHHAVMSELLIGRDLSWAR